jgi:hypothetical protein
MNTIILPYLVNHRNTHPFLQTITRDIWCSICCIWLRLNPHDYCGVGEFFDHHRNAGHGVIITDLTVSTFGM